MWMIWLALSSHEGSHNITDYVMGGEEASIIVTIIKSQAHHALTIIVPLFHYCSVT